MILLFLHSRIDFAFFRIFLLISLFSHSLCDFVFFLFKRPPCMGRRWSCCRMDAGFPLIRIISHTDFDHLAYWCWFSCICLLILFFSSIFVIPFPDPNLTLLERKWPGILDLRHEKIYQQSLLYFHHFLTLIHYTEPIKLLEI